MIRESILAVAPRRARVIAHPSLPVANCRGSGSGNEGAGTRPGPCLFATMFLCVVVLD